MKGQPAPIWFSNREKKTAVAVRNPVNRDSGELSWHLCRHLDSRLEAAMWPWMLFC
jgi:hypothetical protein